MVAEKLQEKGIRAKAYHAGLSANERDDVQEAFINDEINVVCATVALVWVLIRVMCALLFITICRKV